MKKEQVEYRGLRGSGVGNIQGPRGGAVSYERGTHAPL